jgi:hypothetical protein
VAASEWPPTRATVRRCRAGDAFRGAVHGRSSSLEVVFETTHMRMRARYAQHDPAKELGEHLVDQSQCHPRIMPATCHLPRTTARSRAVCTVSGTHRASGVVPEDFPVRIRLWVALNVPPDLYQLPVTVSWAPSRCTSVHSIPHASPRRRLRCPTTAERRAGRPPGCHTPAGAGAYEASMSAVSSGQPNVPPETLRDCRVTRYLLLRLRPVQSSSAVPAGLPTGPGPRRSSRLPLLRQMPRPAGAGDPQG